MERTACRTPTKGRSGVTNIPTWKFDALREALLKALRARDIHVGQAGAGSARRDRTHSKYITPNCQDLFVV